MKIWVCFAGTKPVAAFVSQVRAEQFRQERDASEDRRLAKMHPQAIKIKVSYHYEEVTLEGDPREFAGFAINLASEQGFKAGQESMQEMGS